MSDYIFLYCFLSFSLPFPLPFPSISFSLFLPLSPHVSSYNILFSIFLSPPPPALYFFLSPSLSLPPLSCSLQFELYFGLVIFCGFILFDTQLIVEKFEHGDTDYLWHSIDLFLDFVNIFRRLLIILASKVCPFLIVHTYQLNFRQKSRYII